MKSWSEIWTDQIFSIKKGGVGGTWTWARQWQLAVVFMFKLKTPPTKWLSNKLSSGHFWASWASAPMPMWSPAQRVAGKPCEKEHIRAGSPRSCCAWPLERIRTGDNEKWQRKMTGDCSQTAPTSQMKVQTCFNHASNKLKLKSHWLMTGDRWLVKDHWGPS